MSCSRGIDIHGDTRIDEWTLSEGDRVWLHLSYGESAPVELVREKAEKTLSDTETYWKGWLNKSETGRTIDPGPFRSMIERSALVLKLLYYEPAGTIAAAATTSLPEEIASHLKSSMNVLRGAFFDTHMGRVAYERMKKSQAYAEYLALSYTLKNMDLHELKTTAEKIAFWINMYNVIVIHGVIELGIMDSVKEVRNIFRRIRYQIGDMFFSPEDIEHGILRGNRRPPNSLFKMFGSSDRRLVHSVQELDPRIHFALVCASSSCPPISFYTAEKLDKELTIAGKSFINGGGVQPDRHNNHVSLSRVFKWYGSDFGRTIGDRLRFIAQYLYDENDRQYILDNAEHIKIDYLDYDWRLNRY